LIGSLATVEAGWPDPVEVINIDGQSDIVLICEHASDYIPPSLENLGLPSDELERHIAWDIGARGVTRALSEKLDAPAFLGTYSRLVIDLNRPLESPTSIPVRSESTDIPGNINIENGIREVRIEKIFTPFQKAISSYLDERATGSRETRIVAIHSFTPIFFGQARPWHVGVLFDKSRDYGESVISALGEEQGLIVDANVPYVIDRMEDYAVPIHGEDRGYDAILIEVRQDLIAEPEGQADWASRLGDALLRSS
jgi:predicted N-formylglutamate amidohydrolase